MMLGHIKKIKSYRIKAELKLISSAFILWIILFYIVMG